MNTETNIFNFISKIRELKDQLEKTQQELSNVKKVNSIENCFTGLDVVKRQHEARCQIINDLFPQQLWEKEMSYRIDKDIVDEWLTVLEGQFDCDNTVEVRNDRIGRDRDKVIFRYLEFSKTIFVHIL